MSKCFACESVVSKILHLSLVFGSVSRLNENFRTIQVFHVYLVFSFFKLKEVTPKNMNFLSTIIKISWAKFRHSPTIQPLWCRFFLMKVVSKEAQNSTALPPFWTTLSSQAAFSWLHSVQEILSKWLPTGLLTTTLGYGCSWAILVVIKDYESAFDAV